MSSMLISLHLPLDIQPTPQTPTIDLFLHPENPSGRLQHQLPHHPLPRLRASNHHHAIPEQGQIRQHRLVELPENLNDNGFRR